ncbi:hypothetical protein TNCV_1385561 [Trichonephila clavipes]|nr:hypothetical protein TNCV_1385561 [Trichonephila clavipes]
MKELSEILSSITGMAHYFGCQQVVKHFHWPEAVTYFNRCYELSIELFQKQPRLTYWSVAATLDYYRLKISQEDRFVNDLLYVATKNAIFAQLITMKKVIKSYFPVFLKKYRTLRHDIISLNPEEMY